MTLDREGLDASVSPHTLAEQQEEVGAGLTAMRKLKKVDRAILLLSVAEYRDRRQVRKPLFFRVSPAEGGHNILQSSIMKVLHGLTYEENAAAFQITATAARVKAHRARSKLKLMRVRNPEREKSNVSGEQVQALQAMG